MGSEAGLVEGINGVGWRGRCMVCRITGAVALGYRWVERWGWLGIGSEKIGWG